MQALHHPRTLGPARLRCALTPDASAFRAALRSMSEGRQVAVADLSLGAWRSHAAAHAFAEQLKIQLPSAALPIPEHGLDGGAPNAADFASMQLALRAHGDAPALAGHLQARACAEALPRAMLLAVLPPLSGASWDREDLCFVRSLAQQLAPTHSELVLIGPDAECLLRPDSEAYFSCQLPPRALPRRLEPRPSGDLPAWLLLPGTLTAQLAAACSAADAARFDAQTLCLDTDLTVVCPSERVPLAWLRPRHFGAVPVLPDAPRWLATFWNYCGAHADMDAARLASDALRTFAEGGLDLALRLMERACCAISPPAARTAAQSYLGGMYLLRERYADAAALQEPSRDAEPRDRALLLALKGSGLLAAGAPEAALRCLARAHAALPAAADARERLYLRVAWARALRRGGDAPAALRELQAVAALLALRASAGGAQDWSLVYLAALERGRSQRQLGQQDQARACFEQAFETSAGAHGERDLLYQAACRARLCADQGRWHEHLLHCLNAGLFWCACEVPEAIGAGPLSDLLGGGAESQRGELCHVPALTRALQRAAQRAGLSAVCSHAEPEPWLPSIVALERVPRAERVQLVGVWASGLGVFGRAQRLAPSIEDADHARLRALLGSLLAQLLPALREASFATLVVDAREGRGLPASPDQLLERCAWLRVTRALGLPAERERELGSPHLWRRLQVRLGPAVARVAAESRSVHFKRRAAELALDPGVFRLVHELSHTAGARVPLADAAETTAQLQDLVDARVLSVHLD